MKLIEKALRARDYDLAALLLVHGLVESLEKDPTVIEQAERWRQTKEASRGKEEHREAIKTLSDTAFTRTP